MPREVERYIRIQERGPAKGDAVTWRTLPNCERVPVWETARAQKIDEGQTEPVTVHIFHIPHTPLVIRGHRVTYFGQSFSIAEISDTPQLLGMELRCRAEAPASQT